MRNLPWEPLARYERQLLARHRPGVSPQLPLQPAARRYTRHRPQRADQFAALAEVGTLDEITLVEAIDEQPTSDFALVFTDFTRTPFIGEELAKQATGLLSFTPCQSANSSNSVGEFTQGSIAAPDSNKVHLQMSETVSGGDNRPTHGPYDQPHRLGRLPGIVWELPTFFFPSKLGKSGSGITDVLPAFDSVLHGSRITTSTKPPAAYSEHLQKLLRQSGIYALASLAMPFVSLILSPYLTRHLERADYGSLAVLTTAIALVGGLSQLGLGSAFFRAYNYDFEHPGDRQQVLTTTLWLILLSTVPLTLLMGSAAPWLASWLLGSPTEANSLRLASLAMLCQNLTVPILAWMRAESRAISFTCVSLLNVLTNLLLTLLLVGWTHLGIQGALLATAGGSTVVLLVTLPLVMARAGSFILRRDITRCLLGFGLPNALSFTSTWILQLADRFLLGHMRTFSETAVYSVAYTLGGVLSVVVLVPFQLAWPSTLFLLAKNAAASQIFQTIFRWYSLLLLFMTYALTIAGQFLLVTFYPAAYQGGADLISLIALSTMFFGVYSFLTLGISIRKKVWYAVGLVTLAATINLGANLLLIPLYGSQGAALATLLAYVVLAGLMYFCNQRIYPIAFEIELFLLGLFLGIVSYLWGNRLAQGQPFWAYWGIVSGLLVLYGVVLLVLGWFWSTQKKRMV
jgi:O-antigen/teichoic acid export membrane protein